MTTAEPFTIVDTSSWVSQVEETRGTKWKFWLSPDDGPRWLFKHRRGPEVGDDWAEVVAGEVAAALGVPHAECRLAVREGKHGVISLRLH